MLNTPVSAVRDWPLWWFSKLESAVERGDFAAAARAQKELARLGVRVTYWCPPGRTHSSRRTHARRRV
jgi:hypothetical protein